MCKYDKKNLKKEMSQMADEKFPCAMHEVQT